jgi:hypothetical protein
MMTVEEVVGKTLRTAIRLLLIDISGITTLRGEGENHLKDTIIDLLHIMIVIDTSFFSITIISSVYY